MPAATAYGLTAKTYRCECARYPDRCFRRADAPGQTCFPCSTGNCGLGGTHGYGALKPEEIIEKRVEVVPEGLSEALGRLEYYLARFSLKDEPGGSESLSVPLEILRAFRDAWWAYKHIGGK